MQGTILILEATATNRIMLKVQLSAGYYKVVQSECLSGASEVIARTQPDLIVAGASLRDGGITDICAMRDAAAPGVPLMIITRENDSGARQAALRAGAEDAMSPPLQDLSLLARIRRLIRDRNQTEDLRPRDSMHRGMGFYEPSSEFTRPARVAVVAGSDTAARALSRRLEPTARHMLRCFTPDQLRQSGAEQPSYDAILIDFSDQHPIGSGPADLRLLPELRSRAATRHAAVIALTAPASPEVEAEALDLGADDVAAIDCDMSELNLRLDRRLDLTRRSNRLRAALQKGLRAAVRDPLTGLYNRRFALPHLACAARHAQDTGKPFAVMLADIDHFKAVNDRYGHPTGDQVIRETASRLLSGLSEEDMLARVGGEEFLIVLQNANAKAARSIAQSLRARVNGQAFDVDGKNPPIPISISIGVVTVPTAILDHPTIREPAEEMTQALITAADRALYSAKKTGRNRVSVVMAA